MTLITALRINEGSYEGTPMWYVLQQLLGNGDVKSPVVKSELSITF